MDKEDGEAIIRICDIARDHLVRLDPENDDVVATARAVYLIRTIAERAATTTKEEA